MSKNYIKNHLSFLSIMDLIILIMIFFSYISHFVLGSDSFITSIIRMLIIAVSAFYAGQITSHDQNHKTILWKKFLFYYVLFLLSGLSYDVLISDKRISQSFINMLTLIKVPNFSELFFTIAVILICALLLSSYTDIIKKHRILFLAISVLCLFTVYVPENIIGYPIIGVLIGCDSYKCISILPVFGYFLVGICMNTDVKIFNRKHFFLTGIISVLSCLLYVIGLNAFARYLVVALPVYIICSLFNWLTVRYEKKDFITTPNKCIAYVYQKFLNIITSSCKKYIPVYFLIYTFVFTVTAFFAFAFFRENLNTTIWRPDGISQYFPKAYYFCNYMKEVFSQILQGNFTLPAYDFSLGMGHRISFSYEPIYYLYSLFNPSDIESAYTFLHIFRYFCAGISMSVLLLYFKNSFYQTLFGSIMYAFSGFAIVEAIRHPQFVAPMILLPLLIIATEEIIKNKRWYLCTPLIAVSLLCSYYFHYINTLMIGIYYVARFMFSQNNNLKNLKTFIRTTFVFGGTYILGVLIGNIVLTTSFASYLGSNRSGHQVLATDSLLFYQGTWFKRCLSAFMSMPESCGYVLRFGFIPLAAIGIVMLFIKKEKKILKFIFILFSAFCIFPVAGLALSGFSSVTNRWSYAYALLITFITAQMLPKLSTLSKRELKIIFASIIPYILFILFDRDYRTVSTMTSVAILLLNYMLIVFMNRKIQVIPEKAGKVALLITCMATISVNCYYQYSTGDSTSLKDFTKQEAALSTLQNTPLSALDSIADDSFYRVDASPNTGTYNNASYVLGYNGISEFSSTINGNIMDYSTLLGNSRSTLVRLESFDNRIFMNALAGVKYYADKEASTYALPYSYKKISETNINGNDFIIYQNQYTLPFGYTYDTCISETELLNHNTLKRQEIMLQTATLSDDSSSLKSNTSPDSLKNTSTELEIKEIETDGVEIIDSSTVHITKPVATMTLYFDSLPETETYLEFTGEFLASKELRATVIAAKTVFGDSVTSHNLYPINYNYNTHQETYLYNLGYHEDSISSCTVTFTSPDDTVTAEEPHIFTVDSFKIFGQSMENLEQYINSLSENTLENVQFSTNTVTGEISLKNEKLLVLNIPYEKGWTAYVDGKKTDYEKVNLMYIGLPLTTGDHTIELVYEIPGQKISYLISLSGILIYLAALLIYKYKTRPKKH